MHDIKTIRDNPDAFDAALARRGVASMSSSILEIDLARRASILAAETAQADQNKASKSVGAAKASGDTRLFREQSDLKHLPRAHLFERARVAGVLGSFVGKYVVISDKILARMLEAEENAEREAAIAAQKALEAE